MGAAARRVPGVPAPAVDRRLRRRRVRLRRGGHRAVLPAAAAAAAAEVVPGRGRGVGEHPDRGRRADGRQPLRHDAARRPDDDGRRSTTAPAATCGRSAPTWCSSCRSSGELARKGGATLACNEDAERMLRGGELVGRVAGGLQGHRQAVLRALQAAAVRPRRLRLRGDADRRADRAVLDRRRRGDLPAGRQHARRWPGCSACPTSRSRRSSRCSARWGWCRCRRSG